MKGWGLTGGDLLVLLLAAVLVGGLYGRYWTPASEAGAALITVAGQAPRQVSLDRSRDLQVQGALGPSRLELAPGRIRFTESPCRGKHCIHQGWLSHGGGFAACLPNRVAVQLLSRRRDLDAVNF